MEKIVVPQRPQSAVAMNSILAIKRLMMHYSTLGPRVPSRRYALPTCGLLHIERPKLPQWASLPGQK